MKIPKARAHGDIRVRDIGGRQLSCSRRLLRGHGTEEEREGQTEENQGKKKGRVNARVAGEYRGAKRRTETRKTETKWR